MVTYSISKANADIGETITVSRSKNVQQVTYTFWVIDLQPSDYDFSLLESSPGNFKSLSDIGKMFANHSALSTTVTIRDKHTIAHTLTPITVATSTSQYLVTIGITPLNELVGSSTFTVDIGEPIEVNFNRNIYNQMKFLVNRWTKGKENTSNKVTSISSSSTDTQYPSAKAVKDNLDLKLSKQEDDLITVTNSNIWNYSDYHTKDRWSNEGISSGTITSTTLTSGSQGDGYYSYNFPSNVTSITIELYCDSSNCTIEDAGGRNPITISTDSNNPTTYTAMADDGFYIGIYDANKTVTYNITSITFNMNNWIDKIYPVGAIYISMVGVAPSTLFGGTWERIQNRFLLASGSLYDNGETGGEATHTLTTNEMPSHRHEASALARYAVTGSAKALAGYDPSTAHQTTSYVGGGQAHNNMPPYIGVYMWKRIA